MANRFWVGGNGTWNATAGTKWSTTSGGAGGAAVPTASDDVFLDNGAGHGDVTVGANQPCRSLDCTGYVGTLTITSGFTLSVGTSTTGPSGLAVKLVSGMSVAGTGTLKLGSSATGNLVTWGGRSPAWAVNLNSGGGWTLQDALSTTGVVTLIWGTLDTNGKAVTCSSLAAGGASPGTLTLGASTVTVTGTGTVINFVAAGPLTLNANTSTIVVSDTSSTAKTFAGGGFTFNNIQITGGGTGSVTFTGANTINVLTVGAPKTVIFPASTTTTLTGTPVWNGDASNTITIQSSSAGTQATISKSSGTVTVSYVSLKDSAATGGATFIADESTRVSNVTGWTFRYTNSQSGTLSLSGSSTETKLYPNSGTGALTASGTASATHVGTASGTGALSLTGGRSEAVSYVASGAGTLPVGGAATETKVCADGGAGTVSTAGAAAEGLRYADSRTAAVALSGSSTGQHRGTDSGTVTLVVSGDGEDRYTHPVGRIDSRAGATTGELQTAATSPDGGAAATAADGTSTTTAMDGVFAVSGRD